MDVVVDLEVVINQAITQVNPTRASSPLGLIRQLPASAAARGNRRLNYVCSFFVSHSFVVLVIKFMNPHSFMSPHVVSEELSMAKKYHFSSLE